MARSTGDVGRRDAHQGPDELRGVRAVGDDKTHSEWVDGEVSIFMPTIPRHARIVRFLFLLMGNLSELRLLGEIFTAPFEMKLRAGGSYREPDLLFVLTEHLEQIDNRRLNGPADLVVEVLSADDPDRDLIEKYKEYEEAGIPEYWIVEGREGQTGIQLFVRGLDGRYVLVEPDADGRLRSRVLEDFWLDPAWLAADPLPSAISCLQEIVPDAFRS